MMAKWLLSVFSAVLIVSVSSLLLPDGKIAKFIKPFISIAVIIVIISPIADIKGFFDGTIFENNRVIETDKDLLRKIALSKIDLYSENCVKIAEKNGINGSSAIIEYSVDENGQPKIYGVIINLKNAVITTDSEHIVILQRLKKELSEYLRIDEAGVKIGE